MKQNSRGAGVTVFFLVPKTACSHERIKTKNFFFFFFVDFHQSSVYEVKKKV